MFKLSFNILGVVEAREELCLNVFARCDTSQLCLGSFQVSFSSPQSALKPILRRHIFDTVVGVDVLDHSELVACG